MPPIDLHHILQQTVRNPFGDLVTRPTGQAVRQGVEADLQLIEPEQVVVIDFSTVRCMDFSCADEIVGKLLLTYGDARYFLLRGVSPDHQEVIEPVLERYGLAVAIQDRSGSTQLVGTASDAVRTAFQFVSIRGEVRVEDVADHLDVPTDRARATLGELCQRRLAVPTLRWEGVAALT